jgi:hypothetical protein
MNGGGRDIKMIMQSSGGPSNKVIVIVAWHGMAWHGITVVRKYVYERAYYDTVVCFNLSSVSPQISAGQTVELRLYQVYCVLRVVIGILRRVR